MSYIETLSKVQNAITNLDSAIETLRQLENGPRGYYLEKINNYIETLFARFAPFKIGDKIRLIKTPEITPTKAWGWLSAKHFLIEGAEGVVKDIDLINSKFVGMIEFDNETWLDNQGIERPVDRKGLYMLYEDMFEVIK